MSGIDWPQIEAYLGRLFFADDEALSAAQADAQAAGLPAISISAAEGKLLYLLARMIGARRILEIGTLAGYSTIWLGRALAADGRLVSLELDPRHADIARTNLERAGLSERVAILVGRAVDTLPRLAEREREPFDLVFIDADKDAYPSYLEWATRLCRSGGLIVADNVIRQGAVADPTNDHPMVLGVRRFLEMVAADERLEATVVPSPEAGSYDGLAVVRVR